MAYSLRIDDSVRIYLWDFPGLSREGRVKLFSCINADLRQDGDYYRANSDLRIFSDPNLILYDFLFADRGNYYHFRLILNDADATYGILHIVYADEISGQSNPPPE